MKSYDLGRVVATAGVAELQTKDPIFTRFLVKCLDRYLNNDWGDLDEEDKSMNDYAAGNGPNHGRIFASYNFPDDNNWGTGEEKLWIITEWDHSATTILFPGEY